MKKICLVIALAAYTIDAFAQNNSSFSIQIPNIDITRPLSQQYLSNAFGCTGKNIRPQLKWSNPPKNTKSFAITFYDKDAPTGSGFWQWIVIDIPKTTTVIEPFSLPKGAKQQKNDAGSINWLGPCPPIGSTHQYEIKVYALNVENLPIKFGNSAALIGYFLHLHSIGVASQRLTVSR